MPVERIVAALAKVEKEAMPGAMIYETLPEALGQLPAVVHWLAGGEISWPRDVTYRMNHTIEVRVLFSRADRPGSDAEARPWIERLRAAIDRDPTLGGTVENSGVTGYRYGMLEYAGVPYLCLTLTVRAVERVVAGEVRA